MPTKFVRTKEVAHVHVCKDVPPVYLRKKNKNPIPDSSKQKYQKIVIKVPDEYAFALMEMYNKNGLQAAIMKHIRSTVNPIDLG